MKPWEIVSDVLLLMQRHALPGVDTLTLNNLAAARILELGAAPFNKGYKPAWAPLPFPADICISINDEVAHGIPNANRFLKSGDVVNFDVAVLKGGECGDAAMSVAVGELDTRTRMLLKQAKKTLYAGINAVGPGVKVREVARAIEKMAANKGYVVNRNFTGHCIGKQMHEDPPIVQNLNWNFNDKAKYAIWEECLEVELKPGMRLCLEPVLTEGDRYGEVSQNGWTFKTLNGKPCAMFEHMIEVVDGGVKILTTHITQ